MMELFCLKKGLYGGLYVSLANELHNSGSSLIVSSLVEVKTSLDTSICHYNRTNIQFIYCSQSRTYPIKTFLCKQTRCFKIQTQTAYRPWKLIFKHKHTQTYIQCKHYQTYNTYQRPRMYQGLFEIEPQTTYRPWKHQ